jgi:hypothetical protein
MERCRRIPACHAGAGTAKTGSAVAKTNHRSRLTRSSPVAYVAAPFGASAREGSTRDGSSEPTGTGVAERQQPDRETREQRTGFGRDAAWKASAGRARRESAPPGATGAVPYISRLRRRRGSPRRRWTGEPREGRGSGLGSLGVFRASSRADFGGFAAEQAPVGPPSPRWGPYPIGGRLFFPGRLRRLRRRTGAGRPSFPQMGPLPHRGPAPTPSGAVASSADRTSPALPGSSGSVPASRNSGTRRENEPPVLLASSPGRAYVCP